MLVGLLFLVATVSATCERTLAAGSLFGQVTQFSDGAYGTQVRNFSVAMGVRACDITIGEYTADGVSFGCNGRKVAFVDLGTLAEIDAQYGLGNVIGHLASFFSLRTVTRNGNNETLAVSDSQGVVKYVTAAFAAPTSNPSMVPQSGHLYVVRYANDQDQTLSIVRLFFASVSSAAGSIQSANIAWDIIYYNSWLDTYYLTPNPLCMVSPNVDGPVFAANPGNQGASGSSSTMPSGAVIGLSVAVALVGSLALIALIVGARGRSGYSQVN